VTEIEAGKAATPQQKLEECVQRIAREEGVPPFCEHANEVIMRTLDLDKCSCSALARVILKDLGLTSQVLRAANSALYNHSERQVLSVPRGITLLGWDALRNLVSAIRYIEHFANRSPGLRELMLLSLLTAVHSREIAAATGYPNPEEAHICGLFRNLGEVLVACHCSREYSKIILTMHAEGIPDRAACLRVLDFSWDEVGLGVAEGWNMPSKVYLCLRGSEATDGPPLDCCLASITDYARYLTHALYREGTALDAVHAPWLIDPQGQQTLFPAWDLPRIAEAARKETEGTFDALDIPISRLRLERQAERARRILEGAPVFDADGLKSLGEAVERATRTVRQGDFELTACIAALLDAVRAAGFDRAMFALLNDDQTSIRGRLASGCAREILERFHFLTDQPGGPIRAALHRRTDLLVDCASDRRYARSALIGAFEPAVFALFPIILDGQTVGCFYADRQSATPGLEATRLPLMRVRDAIAAAIRKKSPHSFQQGG
jgi:HD-like signal output (HDOD) protein